MLRCKELWVISTPHQSGNRFPLLRRARPSSDLCPMFIVGENPVVAPVAPPYHPGSWDDGADIPSIFLFPSFRFENWRGKNPLRSSSHFSWFAFARDQVVASGHRVENLIHIFDSCQQNILELLELWPPKTESYSFVADFLLVLFELYPRDVSIPHSRDSRCS